MAQWLSSILGGAATPRRPLGPPWATEDDPYDGASETRLLRRPGRWSVVDEARGAALEGTEGGAFLSLERLRFTGERGAATIPLRSVSREAFVQPLFGCSYLTGVSRPRRDQPRDASAAGSRRRRRASESTAGSRPRRGASKRRPRDSGPAAERPSVDRGIATPPRVRDPSGIAAERSVRPPTQVAEADGAPAVRWTVYFDKGGATAFITVFYRALRAARAGRVSGAAAEAHARFAATTVAGDASDVSCVWAEAVPADGDGGAAGELPTAVPIIAEAVPADPDGAVPAAAAAAPRTGLYF